MLWDNKNKYDDQDIDIDEEANYSGTKDVSRIITLVIRSIILEMQVGPMPEMVSMIDHKTKRKETGKTDMST